MTVTANGEQGKESFLPTQTANTTDKVEEGSQVSHEGLPKVEEGINMLPPKVTKKPVAETHPAKQQVSAQVAYEGVSLNKEESPVDDKVSAQAVISPAKKPYADLKEPIFSQMAHYIQMKQQLDNQMKNGQSLKDLPIFQQINSDIEKLFHTEKINFHVQSVDVSQLQIGEQNLAKANFKQIFDSDKNQETHEH